MTDSNIYGVDGMTRQEFERDLRSRYQHDRVRAHERGIPIRLERDEIDIQERVALNYGKANCPGCGAFDVGMSEVTFDHECVGCQARMRALSGLGPTPKPEYIARIEPLGEQAARAIYQVLSQVHSMTASWEDVPKEFYARQHPMQRRIVYAASAPKGDGK